MWAVADVSCSGGSDPSFLHVCVATHDGGVYYRQRYGEDWWGPIWPWGVGQWTDFIDVEQQAGDAGAVTEVVCGAVADELHLCVVNDNGRVLHTIRRANGSWDQFVNVKAQAGERGILRQVALGC